MLGVVIAATLLGSLVFTAPSSNATIAFVVTAGILLLGRHLNKVAVTLPEPRRSLLYSLYFAIPHLELFDVRDLIIHDCNVSYRRLPPFPPKSHKLNDEIRMTKDEGNPNDRIRKTFELVHIRHSVSRNR